MKRQPTETPIRIGVFRSVEKAERAVAGLREAGFTVEEISVLCSDRGKESHFAEYEHQKPAGSKTPQRTAAGGAIGAVVGGLTAVVGAATTGGLGIFAAGPIIAGAGGGAIAGGFIGAMTTRGMDKDLADHYEQALERGDILVAAEAHDPAAQARLARAEQVLREAGAEPTELREG